MLSTLCALDVALLSATLIPGHCQLCARLTLTPCGREASASLCVGSGVSCGSSSVSWISLECHPAGEHRP